jgi:predicted metal-dependent enzyme (double-stranded beta helix superfamily)
VAAVLEMLLELLEQPTQEAVVEVERVVDFLVAQVDQVQLFCQSPQPTTLAQQLVHQQLLQAAQTPY